MYNPINFCRMSQKLWGRTNMSRFRSWFANLTIRHKLMWGFGLMVFLIFIASLLNLWTQNNAHHTNREMIAAADQALLAEQLRSNAIAADRSIKEGVLGYLSRGVDSMIDPFNGADQFLQDSLNTLAEIRQNTADPAQHETLDVLEENLTSIQTGMVSIIVPQAEQRGNATTGQIGELVSELNDIQNVLDADTHPALVAEFEALKVALADFLPDPGTVTAAMTTINTKIANIKTLLADTNLPDSEQARLVDYFSTAELDIATFIASDLVMGLRIADSIEKVDATSLAVSEYVDFQTQAQATAQNKLDEQRERVQIVQFVITGLVIVLALGLSMIISLPIVQPLQALTTVTKQIAQGNYDRQTHITSRDEIGQLAQSIDAMVQVIKTRETDLREQTNQLRIATAQANEASRVKSEFLASVSHELRTPLNAIIGFSDLLILGVAGELNDKQRHQIDRLRQNGQRLLELVNDVLDLARIEAKRVEISAKPFQPRDLIESIQNQVAPLATKKALEFKNVIDPALPDTLIGDDKRISQVIINLLSNAFKFTEKGQVTLIAAPGKDNPATWSIAVQDTGMGIPPHALDLIFEEFRQVDGSPTRAYGGTGLGLAISRQLTRMMGGQIAVASQLGVGSTFTVTLPIDMSMTDQELAREETAAVRVPVEER